jgi:hypothetical protein
MMKRESKTPTRGVAPAVVLKNPLGVSAHKSQILKELRNGPSPDALSEEAIATLFEEVTEMVYGTRQAA